MGLRRHAPENPASDGPFIMSSFSIFFCFLVRPGFLPAGFPDLRPSGPFNRNFFTHIRTDSSQTFNIVAINENLCPSVTAGTAIIRFKVRLSPVSLALLSYISGFDVLYACQDEEFDRKMGLYSIPAVFGAARALTIAKIIHFVSYLSFMALYFVFDMGQIYLMTTGIIGLLLIFEHWLVKPDDLRHVNIAFFHVNSVISVTLFIGVLADEIARGHL